MAGGRSTSSKAERAASATVPGQSECAVREGLTQRFHARRIRPRVRRLGLGAASIVLGVIWACWHLPLFYPRGVDTTSRVAWLGAGLLWVGAGYFLVRMRGAGGNAPPWGADSA